MKQLTIQHVELKVDNFILDTQRYHWDTLGGGRAGLPEQFREFPGRVPEDSEVPTEHIRALEAWYDWRNKEGSKRLFTQKRLYWAGELKDRILWNSWSMDFRGRENVGTSIMNPQGCDADKAITRFYSEDPMTARGHYWLKVHIANTFGHDKLSLQNRIQWVDDNYEMIINCGRDPLEFKEWEDADSPWQCLAACREFYENKQASSLKVELDATCSGVQIWAAITGDALSAKRVNLTGCEERQDIYRDAADLLYARLQSIEQGEPCNSVKEVTGSDIELATHWLHYIESLGINRRKLTKQPCMTFAYGVTMQGICNQIIKNGHTDWAITPDLDIARVTKTKNKYAYWLAGVLYKDIFPELLPIPCAAMDWLSRSCKAISKVIPDGQPLEWTGLTGNVVRQVYWKTVSKSIDISAMYRSDIRWDVPYERGKEPFDIYRNAQGISPNFIHEKDAAILKFLALKLKEAGCTNVAFVHDAFSTTPQWVEQMVDYFKEVFVTLFKDRDLLLEYYEEQCAKFPELRDILEPPPAKGDWNVEEVYDSEFCIC